MVAFFCRTPIHIFRAIQLKMLFYKDTDCDIYVFDSFVSSEVIFQKIGGKDLFSNCYYIHDKSYLKQGFCGGLRSIFSQSDFKGILMRKTYDEIYLFNLYGVFLEILYNTLRKSNKNIVVNMVEDGPSLDCIGKLKQNRFKQMAYSLLGIKFCLKNVTFWWWSRPDMIEVPYRGEKKALPRVDKNNCLLISTINEIFDYSPDNAIADADILFMEECYWSEGLLKDNSDYEIFKKIKDAFPENNTAVKLHPRTKVNRFEKEFNVIASNGMPWEVYSLNMNMEKKILVSAVACATMTSTKLLYGEETYSLMFYPLFEEKILRADGSRYLDDTRKAALKRQINLYEDKDKIAIMGDVDEATHLIQKWLKRIGE